MTNRLSVEEAARWETIKETFAKNNLFRGVDSDDPMPQMLVKMEEFTDGVTGIRDVLGEIVLKWNGLD